MLAPLQRHSVVHVRHVLHTQYRMRTVLTTPKQNATKHTRTLYHIVVPPLPPIPRSSIQPAPLTFGNQDALDRARVCDDDATSAAASRMSLTVADSTDFIAEDRATEMGEGEERPAVVYLDPMFPHKKKSALVKKGMQMLQGLLQEESSDGGDNGVGSDCRDEEERRLFEVAMRLATRKVVVKRPVHGAAIVGHVAPSHAVVSKNGRFDVYIVSSRDPKICA